MASATEAAGAILISLAAAQAFFSALPLFRSLDVCGEPADLQSRKDMVRLRLGRWLALALEFQLAADVLHTAVAPTWSEIGQLAAIATLRTLLNLILQRELDAARRATVSGVDQSSISSGTRMP